MLSLLFLRVRSSVGGDTVVAPMSSVVVALVSSLKPLKVWENLKRAGSLEEGNFTD